MECYPGPSIAIYQNNSALILESLDQRSPFLKVFGERATIRQSKLNIELLGNQQCLNHMSAGVSVVHYAMNLQQNQRLSTSATARNVKKFHRVPLVCQ